MRIGWQPEDSRSNKQQNHRGRHEHMGVVGIVPLQLDGKGDVLVGLCTAVILDVIQLGMVAHQAPLTMGTEEGQLGPSQVVLERYVDLEREDNLLEHDSRLERLT